MATLAQSRQRVNTFAALRHSNFRLYFFGQLVSISGTWMQQVAQGWLVFHLTRSELWLGIVACASGAPALLLSPFAGVLVDRFPRRVILLCTQTIQMTLAFILALLVFTNLVQVWHIVLLAFLLGIANSVDAPARQAIIKDMVGGADMPSGIALNAIMINGARVVGPAIAGMLLATVGAAWCFFLNGATFLAVLFSLAIMTVPNRIPSVRGLSPLRQMREGLQFARQHDTILPLLLLATVASVFVANNMTLLPAFADTVLHSPVQALALMSTAQGIGAVCAALLLGTLAAYIGRGRVAGVMLLVISGTMMLLSRMTLVPLAVALMLMFGFCLVSFFVNTNTMIQTIVPDEFRGRVMALFTVTFTGIMPFGALALGVIAEQVGAANAMALYGMINFGLALLILTRWRTVWRVR